MKLFQKPAPPEPVTLPHFQSCLKRAIVGSVIVSTLILVLHYYEFYSLYVCLALLFAGNTIFTKKLCSKTVGRFRDIFSGAEIHSFVVSSYMLFPPGLVALMIIGCKVNRATDTSKAFLFQQKKFIFLMYFLLLSSGVTLVFLPRASVPYLASLTSPSSAYIGDIGSQAKIVFQLSAKLGKKSFTGAHLSLVKNLEEAPFNSTGQILGLAVISSEVVKLKKADPKTFEHESALELIERQLIWEKAYRNQEKKFFLGFSPIHILSPVNLVELSLIAIIEDETERMRKESVGKKYKAILAKVEKASKRTPASDSRISAIRSDLSVLFPET